MTQCIHCVVKGHVQGVFYRASTQQHAMQLGLTGWVRNMPNGDVEVVACGHDDTLEKLFSWLWKGPQMAKVHAVERQPCEEQQFDTFSVRY